MARTCGLGEGEPGRYNVKVARVECWTLAEAVCRLQTLQPQAFDSGFNLSLAGGVLNRGSSDTDLDIVAVPRRPGSEVRQLRLVFEHARFSIVGFEEVHPGVQMIAVCPSGRRVEVLIACGEGRDRELVSATHRCDVCGVPCCEDGGDVAIACVHTGLPCPLCPTGTMQPIQTVGGRAARSQGREQFFGG